MGKSSTNRTIGSVISMANMVISLIIGLLYTPIPIKCLGDSEYGVYTLAVSLIAYLSILDLGFGNALVRYTARVRAQGKEEKDLIGMFLLVYCGIAVIAGAAGLIVLFNLEPFLKSSFTPAELQTLKLVFSIFLVNTVISFPASVFSSVIRSHERFIFANSLILVNNIVSHLINFVLLMNGFKSVALALVSLSMAIITACVNVYYCFVVLKIKIGFKMFDEAFYKEVLLYSAYIFINIIVDQLYANTDKVILAKICGSVAVGVYGVGVTFQQYFTQFSTSISSVFLPHISKLSVKEDSIKEMSETFIRVGHIQLIILSLIVVGFACYGTDFIILWAGEGYKDAYLIALLVMIPAIVPLSQNIGISILQALNRHKIRSYMYLFIAIFNVIISIPLARAFQGIGSAIGTAIGNLLGQILFMNWFYYKEIGLDIPAYWRNFIKMAVSLIPVAVVFHLTLLLPVVGWKGLIIKILVGMLFATPYYYFVILNNDEKKMVKDVIKRFV